MTPFLGSSQPAPKPCCDLCGGRDPPCLPPKAQATWMRSQQKGKATLCCSRTVLAGQRHRDISAALVQGQVQVPAAPAEELLPPEELGVLITLQPAETHATLLQNHTALGRSNQKYGERREAVINITLQKVIFHSRLQPYMTGGTQQRLDCNGNITF